MLVVVVVAAAGAVFVVFMLMIVVVMVLVLLMVVVMAATGAVFVVLMVMLMVMLVVVLMIMVVVVLMLLMVMVMVVLVFLVLMIVVMAAAGAVFIMFMLVVMMMLVLMGQPFHLRMKPIMLHGFPDLQPGNLAPGGGDQACVVVEALQKLRSCQNLLGGGGVGAAHDDQVGILHLVVEELAEVAHVHPALAGVHHRHLGADLRAFHAGDGPGHVTELAHAGGLNDDPVGSVILHHLFQRLGEVAHQGAADAAGVHLRNLHPGVLQKAAVNGDLAELVLDQHQLFALIGLGNQLADQGRLTGAQKAGKNVYLGHGLFLHV